MDGREGMSYPAGSASYYLSRGVGPGNSGPGANIHGGSAATQAGGIRIHTPSGFKTLSNPSISVQPNVGPSGGGGGAVSGSSFHIENPSANFSRGRGVAMGSGPVGSQGGEPVKKKRGRPRKYRPEGGANMSLGLSPLSASKNSSGAMSSGENKRKGRPPGTGWKQKLAPLGDWMNSSAGLAFTPHVLRVGVGEDIAAKILAFAQQRARALCIMSANGSVSAITLRQPSNAGATVTYEGRFEILCLSGSYLVAENGGPRSRTGGISISVCSPDGHILGGAIGGRLIAASPVQVVACSFVYGATKPNHKSNAELGTRDESHLFDQSADRNSTPIAPPSGRYYTPNSESNWPPVSRSEVENSQTDIDLMRG